MVMPTSRLTVDAVSPPVRDLLDRPVRRGSLLSGSATSMHIDVDGFLLTITPQGSALLPNAIRVREDRLPSPWRNGTEVTLHPEEIRLPGTVLPMPHSVSAWDSFVGDNRWPKARDVHERGGQILRTLGLRTVENGDQAAHAVRAVAPGGWGNAEPALLSLFSGLSHGRSIGAPAAMLGMGPGLTPQADDVLWAVLLVMNAVARTTGVQAAEMRHWRAVLCPPDVGRRTTGLSATLLRLGARGHGAEPAVRLLDPVVGWTGALERLYTMGHSTGRVSAVAIGAAMCLVGGRAGDV